MPTSCQDVSARMMELLYGELPEGERALIDAHVPECARCRAELEAFQLTRAVARRALDEAPPPRAREAILRAAAAAAGARSADASAPPSAARAAQSPSAPLAKSGPERSSFWGWFRRRWTLPTFATVGAVAMFLLGSRLFLDPAKTYERGREAMRPAETNEAQARPSSIVEGASEAAAEAQARARAEALQVAKSAHESRAKLGEAQATAVDSFAAAPQARPASAKPPSRRKAGGGGGERPALKDDDGAMLRLGGRPTSRGDVVGGAAGLGSGSAGLLGVGSAAAGPSLAPPPASKAKAEKKAAARDEDEASKPLADAPSFVPPPPPRAPVPESAPAETDRGSLPPSSAAATPPPVAANARHKGASPAAEAERLRERADRLFAEGRWAEAAAAYRQLLRADPDNPDAHRWRQRLTAAKQADADAPVASRAAVRAPAKAAKRPAAEQPTREGLDRQ